MEGGARCRMWQTIAATVLLCSLALCLTYFSLHRISKVDKQDEDISEALEAMKGSILFNEKQLKYSSDSAAATGNDASAQSDYEEDNMAEAAWRLLNASLQCGSDEFRLKAMGPGAADLQLEMDNEERLPLIQVPKECGFTVKQTALGLVVIVPYDGCSVKQENGTFTLLLKWREDNVKITCTVLEMPDTPAASESLQQPSETASSLMPQSLHRSKRHLRWPPMYYPCSPNQRFPLCLYTPPPPPPPTTTTTTTTAEPTYPPLINPYYLHKLLALYPIYESYEHHLNMDPQQMLKRMAKKNPGWKLLHMYVNSQKPSHPFQHMFERHPRTTTTVPTTKKRKTTPCPTTTTTTASSGNGCTGFWRQLTSFHKPRPRVSFDSQDYLQFMPEENYMSGSQSQDVADSFWESFPLMHYSSK
ncbi:uncharacterized protein LOC108239620 isoform X2 [Kryptolebias marmoratus]|uniref:uncharacterized protein LOC108239620 isoform X2 n=1 Tax=Kryptolebias marmoratus TaxID=37003 RepID=UPI000D530296|nr:uncharacterized protein LOC108239620 isoform X2 [Kryptolebias marmoratus]